MLSNTDAVPLSQPDSLGDAVSVVDTLAHSVSKWHPKPHCFAVTYAIAIHLTVCISEPDSDTLIFVVSFAVCNSKFVPIANSDAYRPT